MANHQATGTPLRPTPGDFASIAPTMTKRELLAHYSVGWVCLGRWIEESGTEPNQTRKPSSKGQSIPSTFAADAKTMSNVALAGKYGGSPSMMKRWRAKLGLGKARHHVPKARPIPADFAAMCEEMDTRVKLGHHYGVSSNTIARWIERSGIMPTGSKNAVPADFRTWAPRMTRAQCLERWHCSEKILTRWVKETGVQLRSLRRASRTSIMRERSQFAVMMRDQRPDTMITRAAETLQRNRWPTYRCNERGAYDPKGTQWRVGNLVLTEDEMLQKAARYEAVAA